MKIYIYNNNSVYHIYHKRYLSLLLAAVMVISMFAGPWSCKVQAAGSGKAGVATATDAGDIEGLQATPKSSTEVQLRWTRNELVKTYRIYVYDENRKTYTEKGHTDSDSYLVGKLAKSGKEYRFAVQGYSEVDGKTIAVTPQKVIRSKTLPVSPKLSELGARSTTSTYIKWNKVTGAGSYQVYRYDRAAGRWKLLKETSGLSYKDTRKTAASGYAYRVRACMTYNGHKYYSAYSGILRTATVPRSVPEAVYYEEHVIVKGSGGESRMVHADAPYMYVHGYKLKLKKNVRSTGYAIYYQDVRDLSQADVSKARLLRYTSSSSISLNRTSRKGYERIFWVSTYYVYGGKKYVNSSRIPATYGGVRYIYKNRKGKVTGIEEYEYAAVDEQISEIRYYSASGRLKKYERYLYNRKGFVYASKTYNASGKLIKTERWR